MQSRTAPAPLSASFAPASATPSGAFGVYLHWPFCASKCPYCDFNSHVRAGGIDEARFVAAYRRELRHWAELAPGRTVGSIFFGGGTPSLMSPAAVGALLEEIAALWPIDAGVEVTLEANPSSVEAARFGGYRSAGVNRVSLGVQSLSDTALRALGRLHTAAEAVAAIEVTRRTFARFSFDLIYARPQQTLSDWRAELSQALDLAGQHLSLYQLTIEAGTPFAALNAAGKLAIPEEARAAEFYELTQTATAAAGLPAYEISNHARAGEACRHNLLYWRYGEYAGIGAGAHGRLVGSNGRWATSTERQPERWLAAVEANGHGLVEASALTPDEQADEALLMGLRLSEGIDLERLRTIAGVCPSQGAIERLSARGLIERRAHHLRATATGRPVLNALVVELARSLQGISVVEEVEEARN
ncbi:MAG TPA: radical SAM family heme chaperone HemW [Hyphomicrobiaceae bacterium]|jgi:oxygen-independent coproporphyrinogen-3 oxidase|nr:radical SAM family heme chaperone HemW [Hyphomicrobiaceae bacterium]